MDGLTFSLKLQNRLRDSHEYLQYKIWERWNIHPEYKERSKSLI